MQTGVDVKRLEPGSEVLDYFVVRRKELRRAKDGSFYLFLELGNPSGRIPATIWQDTDRIEAMLHPGDPVKILGTVVMFRGNNLIQIEKIRKARQEEISAPEQFLPAPRKSVVELNEQLDTLISTLKSASCRDLLAKMFEGEEQRRRWSQKPGGKLWHHNRQAGLLEHSLSVAQICEKVCEIFPFLNRDLLITAALVHDCGKLDAYQTELGFIDYTDEGRLLGHVALGFARIEKLLDEMTSFPPELSRQLKHLILSHHGQLEHGAPVLPMSPEAIVLHFADEMDSQIDAYWRIAEDEAGRDVTWSRYVRLMDRFFYFPDHIRENVVGKEG